MSSFVRVGWQCELAISSEGPITLRRKWPDGVDLLVVDDYELDSVFETACQPWAKKVMVIEDSPNRMHNADILVNQNINSRAVDYIKLVPDKCNLLVGPGYSLLSDAFIKKRKTRVPRKMPIRSPARLLVSLGGGDTDHIFRVIKGISLLKRDTKVTVVVNSSTKVKEVENYGFQALCNVNIEEMADLIISLVVVFPADPVIAITGISRFNLCNKPNCW